MDLMLIGKVRITGAGQTQYNGSFVVTKVNSLTSFEANLGVSTVAPTATGTIFALPEGFTQMNGNVTVEDENLDGRMIPTYAGITQQYLLQSQMHQQIKFQFKELNS